MLGLARRRTSWMSPRPGSWRLHRRQGWTRYSRYGGRRRGVRGHVCGGGAVHCVPSHSSPPSSRTRPTHRPPHSSGCRSQCLSCGQAAHPEPCVRVSASGAGKLALAPCSAVPPERRFCEGTSAAWCRHSAFHDMCHGCAEAHTTLCGSRGACQGRLGCGPLLRAYSELCPAAGRAQECAQSCAELKYCIWTRLRVRCGPGCGCRPRCAHATVRVPLQTS